MKKVWNVLRVVLAAALLAWLVLRLSRLGQLGQAWHDAKTAQPWLLVAAAVLFFAFIYASNVRWRVLLEAKALHFTHRFLLAVYLAAWFFNNILPTTIGGDVVRILYTSRPGRAATAFSAAFVDRMVGFVGLFFFALLASLALLFTRHNNAYLLTSLVGFVIVAVLMVGLLSRRLYRVGSGLLRRFHLWGLGARLDRLYAAVNDYRSEPGPLVISFLLSMLVQAVIAGIWFLIAWSVGGRVSVLYYFLYIPLIGIISMLPVTPGGLGVREASFYAFFTKVGLAPSQALATTVLYLVLNTLWGLVGGPIFAVLRRERRLHAPPTETDPVQG